MPEKFKKGWRTWRFDQMAVMVNDRIDDPSKAGVDCYVGLEHLDSDSLTIRRWGSPLDVEATKLRFRAGDIIFGRRRVYQRKLGVPNFDGICSAHAMVLRVRPEVTLPEFLPFFMQSDLFMERAKQISVGSLSPTINWKQLAAEEFDLPPMDEQRRIAEVLACSLDLCNRLVELKKQVTALQQAMDNRCLIGGVAHEGCDIEQVDLPCGWRLVSAASLVTAPVTSGATPRDGHIDGDVACPFIKVGDLSFDGRLLYGADGATVNRDAFDGTRSLHVRPGDVLTNIVGPPLGKVSIVPSHIKEALINQAIVRYRLPDPDLQVWVASYLMSSWAKAWLFARSKKTSGQRNINASTCGELPIPMPPMMVVKALCVDIRGRVNCSEVVSKRIVAASDHRRRLAAECLGYQP